MAKILAVSNQKGGVGKSTTAINLSSCLAEAGKKVLLIDMDPQGNTTSGVGIDRNEQENTVYQLIIDDKLKAKDAIVGTKFDRLSVMISNEDLAGCEIEMLELEDREFRLKKKLASIKKKFDFIIIDCPPSLSILTLNALSAADAVLIPIQCEYYALEGLSQLLKTIKLVQERLNSRLKIEGIVFTMYDGRTNLSAEVVENVKNNLTERIFETVIPRNIRLAEAPSYGMPVNHYDPGSAGAIRYQMLAQEIIKSQEK